MIRTIYLIAIAALITVSGLSTSVLASNADFINRGVTGADMTRPDVGADFVNRGDTGADMTRPDVGADLVNRGVDGADVNRGVTGGDMNRPYY
jgi:hypothetical protein